MEGSSAIRTSASGQALSFFSHVTHVTTDGSGRHSNTWWYAPRLVTTEPVCVREG